MSHVPSVFDSVLLGHTLILFRDKWCSIIVQSVQPDAASPMHVSSRVLSRSLRFVINILLITCAYVCRCTLMTPMLRRILVAAVEAC